MQDPELLSLLESSGVPEEAVIVRQASRIYTLATLRDKHRPTFGGIEINVEDMSDCSLGFNAVPSNQPRIPDGVDDLGDPHARKRRMGGVDQHVAAPRECHHRGDQERERR